MVHDNILKSYIQSATAPNGDWQLNVPVGFSLEAEAKITMGAMKEIDALCLTSRSRNLPEQYAFEQTGAKITNSDRIVQPRHYRSMWENGDFNGETATIVEAKSGEATLKGLGQLVGYRELLRNDWNIEVQSLVLVCTENDPQVEKACAMQGIEVVHQ